MREHLLYGLVVPLWCRYVQAENTGIMAATGTTPPTATTGCSHLCHDFTGTGMGNQYYSTGTIGRPLRKLDGLLTMSRYFRRGSTSHCTAVLPMLCLLVRILHRATHDDNLDHSARRAPNHLHDLLIARISCPRFVLAQILHTAYHNDKIL